MPLPSGSRMSTSATSGSACSTRSRPAARLPAVPTTSMPGAARAATSSPPRRASWSSIEDELRHGAEQYSAELPQRAARRRVARRRARAQARSIVCMPHGEGHREAHPAAVADLVPDGRASPGHGARDPARRRGLQRDERGRVRAALLRRPRGARVARHPAHGRQAARRRRRAGDLLAAAGELPPAGDRVLGLRARRAAHRAQPARRRVRLRRAAAPRAPADLLGPPEPAARRPTSRASRSASPRRPAATSSRQRLAKVETAIFRHKTITFDYYTMERDEVAAAQGRPVPPALPGRAVLPRRPLARARRDPRLPPLAHARQGRLRDEGRARLQAPRRLRPARVRRPRRVAVRRAGRHRRGLGLRAHRLAGRAPLRPLRRGAPRGRRLDRPRRRRTPTAARSPRSCSACARTRASSRRRSWPTRSPSASSCCTSATPTAPELAAPVARRARPSEEAGRGQRRGPVDDARRRSGPSASRAW